MTEYIITEKELVFIEWNCGRDFANTIRSRPYQNQRENVDELIAAINRTSLSGFTKYTYRKWVLEKIEELRGEQ